MTQADSVHSTPPTNTSVLPDNPSRRGFLAQAAVAAAAARAEMMSKAEARLSAAIEAAAVRTPEQPPTQGDPVAPRREFNEAMRRRVNIVALLRDISAERLKPALTLKHHEIAKFTERHGVSIEWLLEGKGRIFANEPPNSNRSPAELAALVHTLPVAQQRKIEAVIDLLLEDRRL